MASSNLSFVVGAFAVTWTVVIGYFIHLTRTTRRARTMLALSAKPGAR